MANKYALSGNDVLLRNIWLKTIFFPQVKGNSSAAEEYIDMRAARWDSHTYSFRKIYDAIVNCEFTDIDGYLKEIAKLTYYQQQSDPSTRYTLTAQQIANFLADMCRIQQIYWDDLNTDFTLQEIGFFKTHTLWGKTLNNFELFVSQDPILKPQPAPTAATKPASGTSTSSTSTANNSGSKLNINNASGLVQPVNKVIAESAESFWIKGKFLDPAAKTNPRIHVSPLQGQTPLKVKYKSGQGFDDCILFWDKLEDAEAFKQKVIANCTDLKVDNNAWEIKRVKSDANGYFLVETEFGQAAILASKLHEMLESYNKLQEEKDRLNAMTKEEYFTYMEQLSEEFENWLK